MTLILVYDGDCPLCRASAQALRIRSTVGALFIVNARTANEHPIMAEIAQQGLDLNQGIVVKFDNRLYFADEALNLLAIIGTSDNILNSLNRLIFRHKNLARLLYPAMVRIRKISLAIIRKPEF